MSRLVAPAAHALAAVDASWRELVDGWRDSAAGRATLAALDARLAAGAVVYPARPLRALELTPRPAVRAVIVGQDPYHGPGQAEGLAFSVPAGVALPPSLRNIVDELARDCGVARPRHGHLGAWARRGVLLLNATLTVEDGSPGSHRLLGWEALTDQVLEAVAADPAPKVFLLWGNAAQAKSARVAAAGPGHPLLCCNHPSPLSARRPPLPFAGCGHFGRANALLAERGAPPIDWSLGPDDRRAN